MKGQKKLSTKDIQFGIIYFVKNQNPINFKVSDQLRKLKHINLIEYDYTAIKNNFGDFLTIQKKHIMLGG